MKVAVKPFHRRFYMLKNILKIKSGRSMPCKSKGKKTARKKCGSAKKTTKKKASKKKK